MRSLNGRYTRHVICVLAVLAVATALFSGVAAADTIVGGTIVVEEGETVSDRTIVGSTVVIEGTVDGDLQVYGGDVHVTETGAVTGIVRVYGGSVRIDGAVAGNALIYGGSVTLGETGTIDRTYGGIGSSITIGGTVGGDAALIGGTVTLQEAALVDGSLFYAGEFVDEGGIIDGSVTPITELALLPPLALFQTLFQIGLFLMALLVGALLLYLSPKFADAAGEALTIEPLQIFKTGLLSIGAVVAGILVFSITIVGIPVAIAILFVTLVLAWFASIYARYAIGDWLLSYTDIENRYLSLCVGVTGIAILGFIPFVGWVFEALVLVLGAGVLGRGMLIVHDTIGDSGLKSIR